MLKLIKQELAKFNGIHQQTQLEEIKNLILSNNDKFDEIDVQNIIGKYSMIANNKLIIDINTISNNLYENLVNKPKKQKQKQKKEINEIYTKPVKSQNINNYGFKLKYIKKISSDDEEPVEKQDEKKIINNNISIENTTSINKYGFKLKYIKKISSDDEEPVEKKIINNNVSIEKQKNKKIITSNVSIEKQEDNKQIEYKFRYNKNNDKDDDLTNIQIQKNIENFLRLQNIKYPAQRSEEWFLQRNGRITASDAGMIIGDNKYEKPYNFYIKKLTQVPFETEAACFHGKQYETIATMIYAHRNSVQVIEFGMVDHKQYNFLGASPDGIVGIYKNNGKNKTNMVGRMLEIKVPPNRAIVQEGEIKGEICPIYYWDQVQFQLECCDFEECDFWQCNIKEYLQEEFFIDTDIHEKGVIIRLLPKNKIEEANKQYTKTIFNQSICIYPPKIDMTNNEWKLWIKKTVINLNNTHPEYILEKIIYWYLNDSKCVTIIRDKEWFKSVYPIYETMWKNILYLRKHQDKANVLIEYINSFGNIKKMDVDYKQKYSLENIKAKKAQEAIKIVCDINTNIVDKSVKLLIKETNDNLKKTIKYKEDLIDDITLEQILEQTKIDLEQI